MATTLVRQDIWDLEEEQTFHPVNVAYSRAIGEMKRRSAASAGDPTGWTFQAQIHGLRPPPVNDNFRDQCQHATWFFLPWHRMYLYWFERIARSIIQDLDGIDARTKATWALPYWNYSDPRPTVANPATPFRDTLPPAYRSPRLPDGSVNHLFEPRRDPALNADPVTHPQGGRLGPQITSLRALSERLFSSPPQAGIPAGRFGGPQIGLHHDLSGTPGRLEGTPHGTVHNGVGGANGLMRNPFLAAFDPVFWLHHANIDRLWEVWLAQDDPPRSNPTDTGWLDAAVFHFRDEKGADQTQRVRDVLSTDDLGYHYSDMKPPPILLEAAPMRRAQPEPEHPAEMVGATEEPVMLTGEMTTVQFGISAPVGPLRALRARPPAEPDQVSAVEPTRAYLDVEAIEAEENPGISYGVYVNVPDDDDDPTNDAHHVGDITLFGIELTRDLDRDHSGGHAGLRWVFDISELYERLRAAGLWDEDRITVTFAPMRVEPPPGPALETEPAEWAPVRVGRVCLYYQ